MKMKAEELYELRIAASVTQEELAAHLGVDRRTVGRWENGQIKIPCASVIAIRALLLPCSPTHEAWRCMAIG
jgi:DNA-binding XRE family transcriptional regulator